MPIPIPRVFVGADLCTWEAEYFNGQVDRESNGVIYGAIDRANLAKFRIMAPTGEVLFEITPPPGITGHQLVYRRRNILDGPNTGRRVIIVIGWAPKGPVFAIDVDNAQYAVSENGFDPTIPEFQPPQPMPGEPQNLMD